MKILDASYTTNYDTGTPTLHIWGVGGEHQTIYNYRPYFYIELNDHIKEDVALQLLRSHGFKHVTPVKKFRPIGYQETPYPMYQIFTVSPREIREARDRASRIPNVFKIYEADIKYVNRALIDHGLGGFSDIGDTDDVTMKYMGFDIECLPPTSGKMPDPLVDPVILISMSFYPSYNESERIVLTSKKTSYEGCTIIKCKDEADIIKTFLMILRYYDPDIIAGYNSNAFDIPYINTRCNKLNIRPQVTRDNRDWYIRTRFDGGVDVTITGRVVVDLLPIIRANYSLTRYNLKTVSSLVNFEKLDVSMVDLRNGYISDDTALWDKVVAYSDRDAELVIMLLLNLKLIDKYIAISKASGTLLQEVVNLGQTKLIDNLIIREFKKHNRVMNMRPVYNDEEEDDEVGYLGATVIDPVVGMHEKICIMDFSSLYPSIMRAYNICPSSIIYNEHFNGNFIKTPNDMKFEKDTPGIIPTILEFLYNERVRYKKMMKNAETSEKRDEYDSYQYAFKILLNSIYGYFGYKRSRLYDVNIAQTVTAVGRKTLMQTKDIIESYKEYGLKTIAGDTDSCMFTINGDISFKKAKEIASIIHDKMVTILPPPMSLEFEAYGERGIFLAKKRYAVRLVDENGTYKLKMRGIETRRRDFTTYTTETLEEIINILLTTGDMKKAASYANEQINKIKRISDVNEDPELMKKLLLTKKLTKPIEEYNGAMPHINAIKRSIERGEPAPSIGDRIAFYVTEGKSKNISDRTELEEYVLKKNLLVSKRYYMGKQLQPPIDRIFEALGFNRITMNRVSKQKSLLEL